MAAKIFKAFRFTKNEFGNFDHSYLILAANTSKEAENILREDGQLTKDAQVFLETDETAERNEAIPVVSLDAKSKFDAISFQEFEGWKKSMTRNEYDCGEMVHGPIYRLIK